MAGPTQRGLPPCLDKGGTNRRPRLRFFLRYLLSGASSTPSCTQAFERDPQTLNSYLDALAGPTFRPLPDCCFSPPQKSLNSLRHLAIRRLGTATRIFHANPLWLDVPHSQASLPTPWLERRFFFFHFVSPNFDQPSSQRLSHSM